MKNKDFLTIEGNKVFIHCGFSKIDATMAFTAGLAIGSKEYEKIESLQVCSSNS